VLSHPLNSSVFSHLVGCQRPLLRLFFVTSSDYPTVVPPTCAIRFSLPTPPFWATFFFFLFLLWPPPLLSSRCEHVPSRFQRPHGKTSHSLFLSIQKTRLPAKQVFNLLYPSVPSLVFPPALSFPSRLPSPPRKRTIVLVRVHFQETVHRSLPRRSFITFFELNTSLFFHQVSSSWCLCPQRNFYREA